MRHGNARERTTALAFIRAVLAMALAASVFAACSVGDPGSLDSSEPISQVSLAQEQQNQCLCLNGVIVYCYDSCFESSRCNSDVESCADACLYEGFFGAGEDEGCSAINQQTGNDYQGLCADSGVGESGRKGCCPGCLRKASNGLFECMAGTTAAACGRADMCNNCNDNNPCTVDSCSSNGECSNTPAPEGTGCSDGDACNGAETCNGEGDCVGGEPLDCDDNNPCTQDSCDEESGCTYSDNDGAECSDGKACTINDSCQNGVCRGTERCDDGNPCTEDNCNPNGTCANTPVEDDTSCDDGSNCTTNDVCVDGVCTGSGESLCHDLDNPCQISECAATGGCMVLEKPDDTPCDDGDPCTANDSCQGGECQGGETTSCDDNNACTEDSCTPGVGCEYTNATGECADGDVCTIGDRCQDGECRGNPVECTPFSECHNAGSCDPATGLCTDIRKADGSECTGGSCKGGVCIEDEGTGSAGAPGAAGSSGSAGADSSAGGSSGSAEAGSTSDAGQPADAGSTSTKPREYTGDPFVREEGGCACTTTQRDSKGHLALVLGLLSLGTILRRRRRLA